MKIVYFGLNLIKIGPKIRVDNNNNNNKSSSLQ